MLFRERKIQMLNIKNTAITTTLLLSALLVGCGEDKLMTASYYKENPKALEKILEKCKAENDKGYKPEGNFGENCSTARRVRDRIMMQRIRDNVR